MNPAPIGARIQIISNHSCHHYRIGGIYRVHQIDSDGTFKAIDDQGVEGDYIRWDESCPVGIGWDWLRDHLDSRSLDLLSAFNGLTNLRLRDGVETKIITSIPNLADAILNVMPVVDEEIERLRNQSPDEADMTLDSLLS
jgi:hypothetical protein